MGGKTHLIPVSRSGAVGCIRPHIISSAQGKAGYTACK